MMRRSLRTKILTLALLPAVALYLLIAVLSYFAVQAIAEDLVMDRDRELARLSAAELSASLQDYPALLSGVARDLAAAGNGEGAAGGLAAMANRLTYFDGGVVLLDNLGRVVDAHAGNAPGATAAQLGEDWSTQATFRQIIQSPIRPAFSNLTSNAGGDGRPVVAVAVPVLNARNELRGVLVGQFVVGPDVLNSFYGTLLRLRLDGKGQAYVIDGAGRLIFATPADSDLAGQALEGHPVVGPALAGGAGALRTTATGGEVLASYGPIPGTGWSLIIEEDWATLMTPLRRYAAGLSLLLLLGIIVPALVVAGGMQRVTRPINALVEATRQVARGDFGRTVSAPTGDELETLAEQFNQMSAELQASYAQLEQRVADRTAELQTVLDVSRQVASTLELSPLLTQILDRLRAVVDYRFARLFIMEGDKPVLLEERGEVVNLSDFYYLGDVPEARAALQRGEPVLLADTNEDSVPLRHLRQVAAAEGSTDVLESIGAILSLPLMARERLVGIMTLVHGQRGYYTPTRVSVAMAFAAQAAVAVENARLFAAEAERNEQLRVINQVSQSIAGILDLDGLLRETAVLIHDRFGYDHVGIGLVEEGEVVYRAGAGQLVSAEGELLFTPNRLRVGLDGLTGRAAATGRVLVSPDVQRDPRHIQLAGLDTRSEVVVPLKSKEVVIGVLDIQSERPHAFDESDVELLRSLANQLAVAIENARLYEQAGQLAALEERQKLARELHDSVSQALYGIALGTRTAHTVIERTPALDDDARARLTEPLEYVLAQTNAGMAEMRALIFELRPESLQTEGLVAALRKQTAALSARHQIPVTTEFDAEPALSPAQKEMLYRVAQEAMHNIVKHARATAAEVRLVNENGRVLMEVCDNGQGFDMSQEFPGHLGLKSMRERVANGGALLTIASSPAGGTRISVKV